ncbi:MAG TPA: hypothetical protein VNJ01_07495 [Bacteriovoracaceae bacterium]|nr:hypothetical protein [Bacteriovoracaceae bacterium]
MESSTVEIILTIVAMSFWILFPIGMFISVSQLDKNTDQVVSLGRLPPGTVAAQAHRTRTVHKRPSDWHHPILNFKRWLHH